MKIFEVRFASDENRLNVGVQLCASLQAAKDFANSLPRYYCKVWITTLQTNNDEYLSYWDSEKNMGSPLITIRDAKPVKFAEMLREGNIK